MMMAILMTELAQHRNVEQFDKYAAVGFHQRGNQRLPPRELLLLITVLGLRNAPGDVARERVAVQAALGGELLPPAGLFGLE